MTTKEASTGVNHELFVDVLVQIEKHPETWNQGQWRCDTGMCFAGWAVELSGIEWQASAESDDSIFTADGRVAAKAAIELLGIPSEFTGVAQECSCGCGLTGRDSLFASSNTIDDLYRHSAILTGLDETVLRDKVAAEVQAS